MELKMKPKDELSIECYSAQDGKTYVGKLVCDSYGKLSFQHLD